jgi:hypothetical protein
MKNDYWNEKLKQLETEKHIKETAAKMALVSDEISELAELETKFTSAGTELNYAKQKLAKVTARNAPIITELTEKLDNLKTRIKEVDVELWLQTLAVNNKQSDVARQQALCISLSANKDTGELEFAMYMVATERLAELHKELQLEKSKVETLNASYHELKLVPDFTNLVRQTRELETEGLKAQNLVADIERDRRQMNSRMMFLRSVIAKNEANTAVLV